MEPGYQAPGLELLDQGAVVLGISPDPPQRLREFADESHGVAEPCGVVGPDGRLTHVVPAALEEA
jgi:hypothetical protein